MGEAGKRTDFQFGQWEIMMNLAFRVPKSGLGRLGFH